MTAAEFRAAIKQMNCSVPPDVLSALMLDGEGECRRAGGLDYNKVKQSAQPRGASF